MLSQYDCIVTDGMEADDLICINLFRDYQDGLLGQQYSLGSKLICCSRDKDLRMCPGWHYGWQCGKQEQFGPTFVDELGHLEISQGSPKKLRGTGLKFFYAQLITGDTVDNIPGLPKKGPAFAYKLLAECGSEVECFKAVKQAYEEVFGEVWENALREQTDLLWMIRELNEDGSLKFYGWPEGGILSDVPVVKILDVMESGQRLNIEAS